MFASLFSELLSYVLVYLSPEAKHHTIIPNWSDCNQNNPWQKDKIQNKAYEHQDKDCPYVRWTYNRDNNIKTDWYLIIVVGL